MDLGPKKTSQRATSMRGKRSSGHGVKKEKHKRDQRFSSMCSFLLMDLFNGILASRSF